MFILLLLPRFKCLDILVEDKNKIDIIIINKGISG